VDKALFGRRALAALLRDKRPDLIQVEEEATAPVARQVVAAARRMGVPVMLHTARADELLPLLSRVGRRRLLRRLTGIAASSAAVAAAVRRDAPAVPVTIVPQLGVHVPPTPVHVPHEGLAIGCVGRLVREKGIDTLLAALADNRAYEWRLVVVGDGPDRERLEALASEHRLAARIRWAGGLPPDRLAALWADLDVLVLPSHGVSAHAERSGQLLAEAMAHEVVVLGAATGVFPEVIGEAGVVVPTADRPALAAALRHLTDPVARKPLMQAGRMRAMKQYSDDAVAEQTLAFWKEIVE
jgi:glycosyltransferase involved in cell wall biosynthesis